MASFSVEVPGEANPLAFGTVQDTLKAASSNDMIQVQTGTKQLQAWETYPGYYSFLQDAFLQRSLPPEIRMLSLIQIKNGIDKYWRKSAVNAINATERSKIRERLIEGTLDEPIDRLAKLSSIVISKIARYDFPNPWSDLLTHLMSVLNTLIDQNETRHRLLRALVITHHVVKELGTVRLQRNRQALLSAAPALLQTLQRIYLLKLQQWQSMLSGTLDIDVNRMMAESEQTLKIVRRLLIVGYDFPHRHEEVRSFWQSSISHVHLYLQMHHQPQLQYAYRSSASQHAKQLAKLHVNMAKDHAVSFALLPDTPNLVRSYWSAAQELREKQLSAASDVDDDETDVYDSFNLWAVLLLRACFREGFNPTLPFRYRNSDGKDEPPRAREIITKELLTQEYVKTLFEALVSKFLVYIQSDLEEWISEPEEWDMKEESNEEVFEKSVRAAAERLLLDVTIHFKDLVIEPLLATVRNIAGTNNPLMKDAVYSAIGVAAPILHKVFDFNQFLTSTLVAEMQQSDEMYNIVRRRIAIVCARWIPVDIAPENRALVYAIYQDLLDPNSRLNNQAVRITAAKRLHDVVDEMEFNPVDFKPFVSTIMTRLLDLIREVSLPETKLAILNTISTIVVRMATDINPFAEQIFGLLQTLWDESGSENLLRAVIVTVLKRLVQAMKAASVPYHPLMLPIIKDTVEEHSQFKVYLLEDALDLWIAILEQTEAPASESLLSLIPYLLPLYETEDAIQRALHITRSYTLLSPQYMVQDNIRSALFAQLAPLLSVKKSIVIDDACNQVELIVRAAEGLGGDQAVQIVVKDLIDARFLPHILSSLDSLWISHDSTGPRRKDPPSDWKNESAYLVVLSRIIIASTTSFLAALQAFAESNSTSFGIAVSRFLDEAFNHMDSVRLPTDGKTIAFALTKLLETGQPWILGKLQDLMSLWTSMIVDLRTDDDDKTGDSLVYKRPVETEEVENAESLRLSELMFSDPTHTITLAEYVRHHLQNAIIQCGGEKEFQDKWLSNVDKDVIKAFGELGIM